MASLSKQMRAHRPAWPVITLTSDSIITSYSPRLWLLSVPFGISLTYPLVLSRWPLCQMWQLKSTLHGLPSYHVYNSRNQDGAAFFHLFASAVPNLNRNSNLPEWKNFEWFWKSQPWPLERWLERSLRLFCLPCCPAQLLHCADQQGGPKWGETVSTVSFPKRQSGASLDFSLATHSGRWVSCWRSTSWFHDQGLRGNEKVTSDPDFQGNSS